MSPLGAMNSMGNILILNNLNCIARSKSTTATIPIAHGSVAVFIISLVSIKNPNKRKNNALTKKVASAFSPLNLCTSTFKASTFNFSIHTKRFNSSRLPRNKPKIKIKISG